MFDIYIEVTIKRVQGGSKWSNRIRSTS